MSQFDNNHENTSNKEKNDNASLVFISKREQTKIDQNGNSYDTTQVNFGGQRPYDDAKGHHDATINQAFFTLHNVNSFLKGVDAGRAPLIIETNMQNEKHSFYKVDFFNKTGVSNKTGEAYSIPKLRITIQEEQRDQSGNLQIEGKYLYATKNANGTKGFSFDSGFNDQAVQNDFIQGLKNGYNVSLSASRNDTLQNYPSLMNILDKIPNEGNATIGFKFIKQQGIVIDTGNMTIRQKPMIDKGATILEDEINKNKDNGASR